MCSKSYLDTAWILYLTSVGERGNNRVKNLWQQRAGGVFVMC